MCLHFNYRSYVLLVKYIVISYHHPYFFGDKSNVAFHLVEPVIWMDFLNVNVFLYANDE